MVAYAAGISRTESLVHSEHREPLQLGKPSPPIARVRYSFLTDATQSRRRGTRLALECCHPKQRESTIQRRAETAGMVPAIYLSRSPSLGSPSTQYEH
jgi:hypothetical protein